MITMTTKIPITSITKKAVTCKLTVSGMRSFSLRLRFALMLFKLACWVGAMKAQVDVHGGDA